MNGLELAKAYYEEYGAEMLAAFPQLARKIAVGLAGSGSECLGYDDELSEDHDFEPGFCVFAFIDEEGDGTDRTLSRKEAFQLERAYAKLPKEFMGLRRAVIQPVGGARHGVIRMENFFLEKTGTPDGLLSADQWFTVPEQSLLEAAGGEIFEDHRGEMTRIRARLTYYPEAVRLKKLAGHLLLMAQSGQYNYARCLAHGEEAAAQLSVFAFVKSAASAVFLLNRRYQPYYKWLFRSLRGLPLLSESAELMEYLITTDNGPDSREEKAAVMEGIASDVIDLLMEEGITDAVCGDLEKHAYSVNDRIADPEIRNRHILAGV